MKKAFAALPFLLLCLFETSGQAYQPTWESLDKRPVPAWFANDKFGIFIHWGVYSVPAYRPVGKERYASYAEWYEVEVMHKPGPGRAFHERTYGPDFTYRDFAPMFRAELFNPEEWAALFKRAGARYVVLTAKHHDGFCLWPTKSRYNMGWNSVESGPGRDVVGEVTRAVRAEGLRMGLYYSLLEWETPTPSRLDKPYLPSPLLEKYRIPADQYIGDHVVPQLKELVTGYQPAVIFADGAWDEPSDYWQSPGFLAWLYNNAPNKDEVVVNDRWGKDAHEKHGDYYTSEYANADKNMGTGHPWEENQGIGGSYGFNRAEKPEDYKTSAQLVHLLIDRVSRGGNLLLNVGPAADGTIPVLMQERLLDIGKWLSLNGEAIYGTRPWTDAPRPAAPVTASKRRKPKTGAAAGVAPDPDRAYYTTKGNTLYVIRPEWPAAPFTVAPLTTRSTIKVTCLGVPGAVKWKTEKGQLTITPPPLPAAALPCRYAYVFKVENAL
jgi:alpha-L-fucosidase